MKCSKLSEHTAVLLNLTDLPSSSIFSRLTFEAHINQTTFLTVNNLKTKLLCFSLCNYWEDRLKATKCNCAVINALPESNKISIFNYRLDIGYTFGEKITVWKMALIRTQAFATLYTFSVHKRSTVAVCNWADVKLHCGHTGPLTQFLWHEATRNIATSPWMGCLFVTGLPLCWVFPRFFGTHLYTSCRNQRDVAKFFV